MFASYLKAVDLLTINDENRLQIRVKNLETEKDALLKALENRVTSLEESHIVNINNQVSALHEIGLSTDEVVKLLHVADVFKSIDNGNPEETRQNFQNMCTRIEIDYMRFDLLMSLQFTYKCVPKRIEIVNFLSLYRDHNTTHLITNNNHNHIR